MSGLALQRLAEDRKSFRKRSSLARTSTKLCTVAGVAEADSAPDFRCMSVVPGRDKAPMSDSSKYALLAVSPSDLKRCKVAGSTAASAARAATPRATAHRSPHVLPCDIECDVLVAGGCDIAARCVPDQLLVRCVAGDGRGHRRGSSIQRTEESLSPVDSAMTDADMGDAIAEQIVSEADVAAGKVRWPTSQAGPDDGAAKVQVYAEDTAGAPTNGTTMQPEPDAEDAVDEPAAEPSEQVNDAEAEPSSGAAEAPAAEPELEAASAQAAAAAEPEEVEPAAEPAAEAEQPAAEVAPDAVAEPALGAADKPPAESKTPGPAVAAAAKSNTPEPAAASPETPEPVTAAAASATPPKASAGNGNGGVKVDVEAETPVSARELIRKMSSRNTTSPRMGQAAAIKDLTSPVGGTSARRAPAASVGGHLAASPAGPPLVVTAHDKANTTNALQLLKMGTFKLKPGVDTVGYEELVTLRLEDGIDPTRREEYLADADFEQVFGMPRAEFQGLPKWKRVARKKDVGLF